MNLGLNPDKQTNLGVSSTVEADQIILPDKQIGAEPLLLTATWTHTDTPSVILGFKTRSAKGRSRRGQEEGGLTCDSAHQQARSHGDESAKHAEVEVGQGVPGVSQRWTLSNTTRGPVRTSQKQSQNQSGPVRSRVRARGL